MRNLLSDERATWEQYHSPLVSSRCVQKCQCFICVFEAMCCDVCMICLYASSTCETEKRCDSEHVNDDVFLLNSHQTALFWVAALRFIPSIHWRMFGWAIDWLCICSAETRRTSFSNWTFHSKHVTASFLLLYLLCSERAKWGHTDDIHLNKINWLLAGG